MSRLPATLQHRPAGAAAHPQPPADRQAQEGDLRKFPQKHNRNSFRQGISIHFILELCLNDQPRINFYSINL